MIALIIAGAASAKPSAMLGVGYTDCAETVKMSDDPDYRLGLLFWFGGYVSGLNMILMVREKKFYDVSGLNKHLIVGSIIAYCTKNQGTAKTFDGADHFIQTLPQKPWVH